MKLTLKNIGRIFEKDGYQTQALNNVHLDISEGDQIMIVGESGSGKSTLLNIIGLLDRGYTGHYLIDDNDVANLKPKQLAKLRNKLFGYIFQDYVLLESETIYENVKIPLLYSDINPQEYDTYIETVLKQVELYDVQHKKVKYLSGGQRQRVAIARSLVNQPSIVLADEPTGSLDSKTRDNILDIIYNYLDDSKILLFVTHDFENNKRGNQRKMMINKGEIIIEDK